MDNIIQYRDKLYDETALRLKKTQEKQNEYHNTTREVPPALDPGETVYNKIQGMKSKIKDRYQQIQMLTNTSITLILFLCIRLSYPQSIRILNLQQNPGLLTLETGYSFIKLGNHKLFHIQQTQIKNNIISARLENEASRNFQIFREVIKINYNLDNLKFHLEDLSESIQLAKTNIISKQILSVDELGLISNLLEQQNVRIDRTDQIYNFLGLSAFFNNSKIIFVVSIPRIENSTYTEFLLEPIPLSKRILKLPASVALQNDNKTYFIKDECQHIGKTKLCSLNNLIDISRDLCFSKLLRGLSGNCTFTKSHSPTEIKRIMDDHIIIKNIHDVKIESNCGLTSRNLSGTYLVEFHNCSVFINDTEYNNVEVSKSEPTFIMPLDGLHINEQTLETKDNIEEIHIKNRHHIETITRQHKIQTYTSLSMSSICLFLSFVTGLLWIFKRRRQISLFITTSTNSKITNRDDSSSKGGVVKNEPARTHSTHHGINSLSILSSSSSSIMTTTTTTTTNPTTIASGHLAWKPTQSTSGQT
ncbi:uncharacterized protein LOC131679941 [Topomyia yanbarensis]|uniref:uncharacterized protein LOC131679941 n=1 Tax=Topomyia yanbarensis TaxID=2498891 RepID=UPI00273CA35A|nr:uncharacterized protein LOC131679941 [Topomyia yanbarensis]